MPALSIILPAYESHRTIDKSLDALANQTFQDSEIIVVDSSPSTRCRDIVKNRHPHVVYHHSRERLLPEQARNHGADLASGQLLAFTDPDAYARADWLELLVRGHKISNRPVVGGVACYGRKWLDIGAHFTKFDKWLPRGKTQAIDMAPTVNFLIPKDTFRELSGFGPAHFHSDTDLSWKLVAKYGAPLFVPKAVVEHHHILTLRSLVHERFARGIGFGELRLSWADWPPARMALMFGVSIAPLRLVKQLIRVGRNARSAGMFRDFVVTFPIIALGLYAWLLGEARTYRKAFTGRSV